MNCARARKIISLVIDGEATSQQKRLLDFHLMGCSSCRRASDMSLDIARITRTLPSPVPPANLEENVREMLRNGAASRVQSHRKRSAILTLPAAAAILILAITLLPFSSPGDTLNEPVSSGIAAYQPKNGGMHLSSKSGIRTAPLSEYSRQASLISF